MDIQTILTQPALGINLKIFIALLIVAVILKGMALWKASQKNSRIWFWILLITNTLGVLPLLYLIINRKK